MASTDQPEHQPKPQSEPETEQKCGFITLVGRPNVGKSTLLNHMVGQKVAITSRRPQTTRQKLIGIYTDKVHQLLFVDTPGLQIKAKKALDQYMNQVVEESLSGVDLIVMVVNRNKWVDADESVLRKLIGVPTPKLLAINKIDLLADKKQLLPFIDRMKEKYGWDAIVPLAALRNKGVQALHHEIAKRLPASPHLFPAGQIADRDESFLIAEIVREKIMRQIGDEVPYQTTVQTESVRRVKGILHIRALITVEKSGQKMILIGRQGQRMKAIGQHARISMERLFGCKVMLRLWVKVQQGWSSQPNLLKRYGFVDTTRQRTRD